MLSNELNNHHFNDVSIVFNYNTFDLIQLKSAVVVFQQRLKIKKSICRAFVVV